jgi:hypothetical protein
VTGADVNFETSILPLRHSDRVLDLLLEINSWSLLVNVNALMICFAADELSKNELVMVVIVHFAIF